MRKAQRVNIRKFGYLSMLVASLIMAVPTNVYASVELAAQENAAVVIQQEAEVTNEEKSQSSDQQTTKVVEKSQKDAELAKDVEAVVDEAEDQQDLDYRCTGLYVGKDVTETGDTYVGRNEDLDGHNHKVYEYVPPADHNPETDYYHSPESAPNFKLPMPAHTVGYTCYHDDPNSAYWKETNPEGYPVYAACGINDNGIAITATTSLYPDGAEEADPFDEDKGITESVLGDVLLSQATSPKQACELAGSIIDTWGSGEGNQIYAADTNETWVFSVLSGHQWIAFKLPSDKVCINPNIGGLQYKVDLNDTENVIHSKDLVKLAKDNGFAKFYDDGTFNVFASYGEFGEIDKDGKFTSNTNQLVRLWQGYEYFTDSDTADKMMADHPYLFSPKNTKLSTFDILRALAVRGAGTKYDATKGTSWIHYVKEKDPDGNPITVVKNGPYRETYTHYSIGNMNNLQEHVFQIRNDESIPQGLRIIQWECMGPGEWGLFLPIYNGLVTKTSDVYHAEDATHNEELSTVVNPVAQKDMYYTMNDFNRLVNYIKSKGADVEDVREFVTNAQKQLISQAAINEAAMMAEPVENYTACANTLSKTMSDQVQARFNKLNTELRKFIEENIDEHGVLKAEGKKFVVGERGPIVDLSKLIANGAFIKDAVEKDEPRKLTYNAAAKVEETQEDGSGTATGTDESQNVPTNKTGNVDNKDVNSNATTTDGESPKVTVPETNTTDKVTSDVKAPDAAANGSTTTTEPTLQAKKTSPKTYDSNSYVAAGIIALGGAAILYVSIKKRNSDK